MSFRFGILPMGMYGRLPALFRTLLSPPPIEPFGGRRLCDGDITKRWLPFLRSDHGEFLREDSLASVTQAKHTSLQYYRTTRTDIKGNFRSYPIDFAREYVSLATRSIVSCLCDAGLPPPWGTPALLLPVEGVVLSLLAACILLSAEDCRSCNGRDQRDLART